MTNYLKPINLFSIPLLGLVPETLAGPPSNPALGRVYYDTTLNTNRQWNGTAWIPWDATQATGIPNSALATNPLARANHTGTQTSSTISDLAPTVKGYTLDSFAAPVANVGMNGQRLTGLADPANPQDAATMNWTNNLVNSVKAGILKMAPVVCVATANLSLSGLPTIDGVTVSAGQRVLATGQTNAAQNGPYVVASGTWSRVVPVDGPTNELGLGSQWYVESGTQYAGTNFTLNSPISGTITPGTTAVTIVQDGSKQTFSAANGIQLVGTQFSGQVVAGGGILATVNGFQLDTSIATRKYATSIGDGSSTSYTITHNLGTTDIGVWLKDALGNRVETDWQAATTSTAIVSFTNAPAVNAYRVLVVG